MLGRRRHRQGDEVLRGEDGQGPADEFHGLVQGIGIEARGAPPHQPDGEVGQPGARRGVRRRPGLHHQPDGHQRDPTSLGHLHAQAPLGGEVGPRRKYPLGILHADAPGSSVTTERCEGSRYRAATAWTAAASTRA